MFDEKRLGGLFVEQGLIQRASQPPQQRNSQQRPAGTDGRPVHDASMADGSASRLPNMSVCGVSLCALICSLTH